VDETGTAHLTAANCNHRDIVCVEKSRNYTALTRHTWLCPLNQSTSLDTVTILSAIYLKDKAILECPIMNIKRRNSRVKITRNRDVSVR
jgi:hypothetical protein